MSTASKHRPSYLRFSPLARVDGQSEARLVVAWPVVSVPIRFWSEKAETLDLLEEAVLGLARAGTTDAAEIRHLLGIPDAMAKMVDRTQKNLWGRGYVTQQFTLTTEGQQALQTGELINQTEYRSGWLLADRVRGGLFPFVHPERLLFFPWRQIELLDPVFIPAQSSWPSIASLRHQAPLAVTAFNRRRRILAELDEEQKVELEREYDEPDSLALERREVTDLELLPEAYYEQHYLLVEVIAELMPGTDRVALRSISPFSLWEQNLYLESLERLASPLFTEALDTLRIELQDRARQLVPSPNFPDGQNAWEALRPLIHQQLSGVELPAAIVEKVHECEYWYQQALHAEEGANPVRRETIVNAWGVLLEQSLKKVVDMIAAWEIPDEWRKGKVTKGQALDWYHDQLALYGRANPWFELPGGIEHNLTVKVITQLHKCTTYSEIWGSSGRDELAKLMLAALKPTGELPKPLMSLSQSIDDGRFPFTAVDHVVDARNDAAHGGEEINQLSVESFRKRLDEIRAGMYTFLRCLFINEGS